MIDYVIISITICNIRDWFGQERQEGIRCFITGLEIWFRYMLYRIPYDNKLRFIRMNLSKYLYVVKSMDVTL